MIRDISNRTYVGTFPAAVKPRGLVAWLMELDARYRQRNVLSSITEEQLRDVGLDRKDVTEHLDAPFWDPPIQLR